MTTKLPHMEWHEVEAAHLWALIGYPDAQIARAMGFSSQCIQEHVGRYDRIGYEATRVWLAAGYSQAEIDAGMARGGWSDRSRGTRLLP